MLNKIRKITFSGAEIKEQRDTGITADEHKGAEGWSK